MSGDGMGARAGYGAPTRGERTFATEHVKVPGKGFLIASSARLRVGYDRKRAEPLIMAACGEGMSKRAGRPSTSASRRLWKFDGSSRTSSDHRTPWWLSSG
jgi:hypothetical protein